MRRSPADGLVVVALCLVGLLVLGPGTPVGTVQGSVNPSPPPRWDPPALVPHGFPLPEATSRPLGGPNNTLVVGNCSVYSNAEVEQAYDAAAGVLYETWIGCQGIGFSRSTDGGQSFIGAQTVAGSVGYSWDPAIAVAPNGTVFVAYMTNQGSGDTPMVAWSTDHGASFAGDAAVFTPTGQDFSDRDFVAVAPNGTVYLTWDYSPNASIDQIACPPGASCYFTAGDYNAVLSWSSDGGRHWSSPVAVDPEYPWGGAVAAPLLVEPNGSIDILYEDYATNASTHALGRGYNYFTQSTDGGRSFSARQAVANRSFSNEVWWIDGDIARDAGGTLYATFDASNGTNDSAYVAVSTTDGARWAAPVRLNPDNDSAAHIMVEVSAGAPGLAHVTWMTNNSTGGGWVTALASLSANGSVLSQPTLVSDRVGTAGYWVGDTLGISELGGGAVAVSWTYAIDRNGTTDSQVYAAVVGLGPPGAPQRLSAVPGAANATLSWTAPNGTMPVTGYTVTYGIEGQATINASVNSTRQSLTVTGLQPYSRYLFSVRAFNPAGLGPPSPSVALMLTAWAEITGSVVPQTANVTIDGAPVSLVLDQFSLNTTPGLHLVRASAPDYTAQSRSVDAPWNGSVHVPLVLAPANGTVAGNVSPAGARVFWDGAAVGVDAQGSFAIVDVAGTVHVLSASAYGYQNATRTVQVPDNSTVTENLTLVPENGTLSLTVVPVDSQVWVGGVPVPLTVTGTGNYSRSPGVYPVEVVHVGFAPAFGNYTVRSLQVTAVNVSLESEVGGGGSGTGAAGPLLIGLTVAVALGAMLVAAVVIGRRRPPAQRPGTDPADGPSAAGPPAPPG